MVNSDQNKMKAKKSHLKQNIHTQMHKLRYEPNVWTALSYVLAKNMFLYFASAHSVIDLNFTVNFTLEFDIYVGAWMK